MKVYEKVRVPAKHEDRLVEIVCDLCGSRSRSEWRTNSSDATEIEVKYRTGWTYPEGGSAGEATVDMCPTCWTEKFVPWLATLGAKPSVREWDW